MNFNVKDTNFLTGLNTKTKIILSLLFSVIVVFLETPAALWIVFGASVVYLLPLKKYKLMIIMYIMILLMFGISSLFTTFLTSAMKKITARKTEMMDSGIGKMEGHEKNKMMRGMSGSEKNDSGKPKMPMMKHPGSGDKKISMVVPFLRTSLMMNLMFALTLSSGIRKLTNVLKTLRLPRFLFLPIIVVFRFVPSFLNEIKQIAENMKIKTGKPPVLIMFSKPRLYLRLLLIPSVIRTLRAAEELSAAAELKGIEGSKNITNSAPESWKFADFAVLFLAVIFIAAAFYFNGEAI
ncbi:MAG: hypothetical protein CSB55_04995 [Candidatus Cloacimonadota bacterium]|nr:MAG: hypothetical protein CSB55_04995 [Candidatus Cloacimonadota bacterium]